MEWKSGIVTGSFMRPVSARVLRDRGNLPRWLSLGDSKLDQALGGGIAVNKVTEIAGEAGAGKTGFCLTLSTRAQLPLEYGGLGGKVCYLSCGEGEFPAKRIEDIAKALEMKLQVSNDAKLLTYTARTMMENIYTSMVYNTDALIESLKKDVIHAIEKENVRLLIIDSIAGVVRPEFNVTGSESRKAAETYARSNILQEIGDLVRGIARRPGVAVVITNQVSDYMGDHFKPIPGDVTKQYESGRAFTLRDFGVLPGNANGKVPCLGPTWTAQIHARLLLIRDSQSIRSLNVFDTDTCGKAGEEKESGGSSRSGAVSKRALFLEFSPCQASRAVSYEICSEGIRAADV